MVCSYHHNIQMHSGNIIIHIRRIIFALFKNFFIRYVTLLWELRSLNDDENMLFYYSSSAWWQCIIFFFFSFNMFSLKFFSKFLWSFFFHIEKLKRVILHGKFKWNTYEQFYSVGKISSANSEWEFMFFYIWASNSKLKESNMIFSILSHDFTVYHWLQYASDTIAL